MRQARRPPSSRRGSNDGRRAGLPLQAGDSWSTDQCDPDLQQPETGKPAETEGVSGTDLSVHFARMVFTVFPGVRKPARGPRQQDVGKSRAAMQEAGR